MRLQHRELNRITICMGCKTISSKLLISKQRIMHRHDRPLTSEFLNRWEHTLATAVSFTPSRYDVPNTTTRCPVRFPTSSSPRLASLGNGSTFWLTHSPEARSILIPTTSCPIDACCTARVGPILPIANTAILTVKSLPSVRASRTAMDANRLLA